MTEIQEQKLRLNGLKTLVTGAASGIGKAIALRFANEGADVCCVDLNKEGAEETSKQIKKLGRESFVLFGDVSKSDTVQNFVEDYYNQWSHLDVLVNCAGIGATATRIIAMDEEKFDRIMRINVKSVFLMCKYFGKKMRKRKTDKNLLRGKIINISSMRGRKGRAMYGAYSASKAAVISLTQTLAQELGKSRITVNAITPGLIKTPMYGQVSEENLAAMNTQYPAMLSYKPVGKPEDVAGAAFFLASHDSDWITGQCIPVSGGQDFI